MAKIECNKWSSKDAKYEVIENGLRLLIGIDISEDLEFAMQHKQ